MKFCLLAILLTALLIFFGNQLLNDPGYVLLHIGRYSIETSLWVFVGTLILGYLLVTTLIQSLKPVGTASKKLQQWQHNRHRKKTLNSTLSGILALVRGHPQRALSLLQQPTTDSDLNIIRRISAARAAQQLGDVPEQNEQLHLLIEASQGHHKNTLQQAHVFQAEIQASPSHPDAIQYLEKCLRRTPKDIDLLCIIARSYEKTQQWPELRALLPRLKKHKVFAPHILDQLERTCFHAFIAKAFMPDTDNAAPAQHLNQIILAYKKLPRHLLESLEFHSPHLDSLIPTPKILEKVLLWLIQQTPHPQWIEQLGTLKQPLESDTTKQLSQLTKKTAQDAVQAAAWFSLGQHHKAAETIEKEDVEKEDVIKENREKIEKAEEALQKSLAIHSTPRAHLSLAKLYQQQGHTQAALDHYEQAELCAFGA